MTQPEHPLGGASPGAFNEGELDADGFRIRYLKAGQGDQVVILESATWGLSKVRDALARNYSVTAIELPGFGLSATNTKSQSVQDLAGLAAKAVDQIVSEKITLIGTSFAANVALYYALQTPDKLEGLILISPTAILPNEALPAGNREERCLRLLAHPANLPDLAIVDPAIWAKEEELERGLNGGIHDAAVAARLGEVRCPTLVVFGANDKIVAPEAARVYRERIPNSNISFVYDSGHLIEAERPDALINAVSDYVEHRETFIIGRENHLFNP